MSEVLYDMLEEYQAFYWILNELHHYSRYDLERIRLEYARVLLNIAEESNRIVNSEGFKKQLKSDELVCGEKL